MYWSQQSESMYNSFAIKQQRSEWNIQGVHRRLWVFLERIPLQVLSNCNKRRDAHFQTGPDTKPFEALLGSAVECTEFLNI